MKREVKIIIAGGGTGGHLFPGIAIAEEFLRRNEHHQVLFLGTNRGMEKKVLGELGYPLMTLDVEGVKGRGLKKAFLALCKLPGSLMEAFGIIRRFRPDIVIGVGGYASGPAVLAAWLTGIPTAVAEQNALPGSTNRILGKFVDRVFVTFPETGKWFSVKKTIATGNPIRASFFSGAGNHDKDPARFTLLIFGGSQGAHAINQAMADALGRLQDVRGALRIIHQTGQQDKEWMERAYREHGVNAEVVAFIMDMPAAYRSADLLICRAGATSIAEIMASGKAAILIPFPYAIGDHQTKNAEVLVRAGAAELIPEKELTGERLAESIARYYRHPKEIRLMGEISSQLGNVRAAADVVDACMALLAQRGEHDARA